MNYAFPDYPTANGHGDPHWGNKDPYIPSPTRMEDIEWLSAFSEAASTKETIVMYLNKYTKPDTHKLLAQRINDYYSNNTDAMTDGLVEHRIIFGDTNRQRMLEVYGVDEKDFKTFSKSNTYLKRDFKVTGNLLYLELFKSHYDTKEKFFLDFMALVMYSSLYVKYFKHGVNPAKMQTVLDTKVSTKSTLKKTGSAYLACQEVIEQVQKWAGKRMYSGNDKDVTEIIASINTRINAMIKSVSQAYYAYHDDVQKAYVTTAMDADGKSLNNSNNSLEIDNLRQIIRNYHPSSLDHNILNTLKVTKEPVKVSIMNSILLDREADVFYKIADLYLAYYTENYGDSIDEMKRQWIHKCMTARMNSKEMKVLEKYLHESIKYYAKKAIENQQDIGDLRTNAGVVKFTRTIKHYVIIKVRHLMNEI